MKHLFTVDAKDYDASWSHSYRPSVRAIIENNGKLALVHELQHDYYLFPGGGIDKGETHHDALIREVKEETGLTVIPESIKELGLVVWLSKSCIYRNTIFEQQNYYYFCKTLDSITEQKLEGYEVEAGYTLEYITLNDALEKNLTTDHNE